jgi:hypothetical protein
MYNFSVIETLYILIIMDPVPKIDWDTDDDLEICSKLLEKCFKCRFSLISGGFTPGYKFVFCPATNPQPSRGA